jgi:hypothetical protein
MKIGRDALEGLYVGLSVGIGIAGFVIVALLVHWVMPEWNSVSDFGNFLMIAAWAATVVIYFTVYAFGATCIYPSVKKIVLGKDY